VWTREQGSRIFIIIMWTNMKLLTFFEKLGEDRAVRDGSGIALGQTASGRYLRVIYVPEPEECL
jgi:hypothetical protein